MQNQKTRPVIQPLVEEEMKNMQVEVKEGDAALEAISPEMSIRMFESSPLRSYRNFNTMTEEQLSDLMQRLKQALQN